VLGKRERAILAALIAGETDRQVERQG